jgi:PAS domain S-box-containing protein
MKNRLLKQIQLGLVLVAITLLGYLIFMLNEDISSKAKWVDKVYELKLLNNNLDTIITRSTGFYNYDNSKDLVQKVDLFFKSMNEDKTISHFLKTRINSEIYKHLKESFAKKEQFVHTFNSSNAIINHATRYLTTIITQMPNNEHYQELVQLHAHLLLLGKGSETKLEDIEILLNKIKSNLHKEESFDIALYTSHVKILLENFAKLSELYTQNQELDLQSQIDNLNDHLKIYVQKKIYTLDFIMKVFVAIIFLLILIVLWLLNDKTKKEIDLKTFKKAVEKSDNYIVITDVKHKIEFINDTFLNNLGFTKRDIIGKTPAMFKSGINTNDFYEELEEIISSGKKWSGEFISKDLDGNLRYEKATITPIFDAEDNITHYIAIKLDVTADKLHQKEIEEKNAEIEKRYFTDYLTNLKNRNYLMQKLDKHCKGRLFYININDFTQLKTFYGVKSSDIIIKKLADTLVAFSKSLDCSSEVFRIKSDEFCIWCTEDKIPPKKLMERLHSYIQSHDFIIDATLINFDVTIGCTSDIHPENQNRYLEAEIAHHNARRKNLNFMIYEKNNFIESQYKTNIKTIKLIQDAIADDRVIIYFQPIFDLKAQSVYMYEVLVRIATKNGNILTPDKFLETAKMTLYYDKIMHIVIKKTFEMMHRYEDVRFSINFSNIDFTNEITKKILIEELLKVKRAENLTLEILESENIQDYFIVKETIDQIKKFGCKISIDDFGSGHSNYYRLSQLDVDYIKIDGSIIKNLDKDIYSLAVIETIISFAKKMHYPVVAEYVHSKKILEILKRYEVDFVQGFYLGKPKNGLDI